MQGSQAEADATCCQLVHHGFQHLRGGDVEDIDGASVHDKPFEVWVGRDAPAYFAHH